MKPAALLLALTATAWYGTTLPRLPTGLVGAYYAGPDFAGLPKVRVLDDTITTSRVDNNWPWKTEPFSVRWHGFLTITRGGLYRFSLISDDGSWLYLDGQRVIDNGGAHPPRQVTADVHLERGVHDLRVEYFQLTGPFSIELLWAPNDRYSFVNLAGMAISPRRPSTAQWLLRSSIIRARLLIVALWVLVGLWWLLALAVVRPMRALVREQAPNRAGLAVGALLAVTALVGVAGITWGLPGQGWALDEVTPVSLLAGLDRHFSHGWSDKYPPAHYYLLSFVTAPLLLWRWLDPVGFSSGSGHLLLFLIFRTVSVLMSVWIVLSVYLCGRYFYEPWPSLVAAALVAFTMPFVYYAKLANVDVPYVFWFSLSLLSFLRVVIDDARIHYVVFGLTATLAICTKDQAYGLYVLPALAIAWTAYRRAPGRSVVEQIKNFTRHRHLLMGIGLSVIVFALCHNLVFNFSGFMSHVTFITGGGAASYRMFEPTISGQLALWRATWMLLRLSFGWPAFMLCVAGLALLPLERDPRARRLWWVLLPAISYYATFLMAVGYTYDRFLLPICLVMALLGGFAAARLERALSQRRVAARVVPAAVVLYTLAYGLGVNAAMLKDSRYTVEDWLRAHARAGSTIGLVGPVQYAPRVDGFLSFFFDPTTGWILAKMPDYIVVNEDYVDRFGPGTAEYDGYRALRDGHLGYRAIFRAKEPVSFAGIPYDGRFDILNRMGFTSLTKINPPIAVYRR